MLIFIKIEAVHVLLESLQICFMCHLKAQCVRFSAN